MSDGTVSHFGDLLLVVGMSVMNSIIVGVVGDSIMSVTVSNSVTYETTMSKTSSNNSNSPS